MNDFWMLVWNKHEHFDLFHKNHLKLKGIPGYQDWKEPVRVLLDLQKYGYLSFLQKDISLQTGGCVFC